ncbi:MAG: acetylornithine deacetylase [Alphaproteobacteria bacterium]
MSSVDILDRLIAFNTVSRTPNIGLIRYVAELLTGSGIECRIVEGPNGENANLYAKVGPDGGGGVMLSGHTDVVPVAGQNWTVDPFRMTARDGKYYGRGTTDMKGFVACAVRAMLLSADRPLTKPLHLALSYDEEIGCVGVRRLLDILDGAPDQPGFCIVGEPTELTVATGHKGKIAARAVCTGREVHSALAPQGVNAIHLAADFVAALRDLQAELAERGARDPEYDIPYSTVHAGIINGGTALNIVPNHCSVDFEIRHLKADDPEVLLGRVEVAAEAISKSCPEGCGIAIEIVNRYPGLDTSVDAEIVSFVKSLTGANATTKVAFGTEGGLFDARLGIPTVVCGPGSMAQGHKPDEFIEASQMAACDRFLETLLDRMST